MAHEASSPPVRQRCVAHVHLAGLTSPTPNPAQTSDTLTSSILVHKFDKFDPGAPGLLTRRHTNHVSKAVVEVNSSNGFALRVRLAQFVHWQHAGEAEQISMPVNAVKPGSEHANDSYNDIPQSTDLGILVLVSWYPKL